MHENIVPNVEVGPNAYAIGIDGDGLAPLLRDGQRAVFDPDAGRPVRGDVVAVWLHGQSVPFVVKLALALPPADSEASDELEPILVGHTEQGPRTLLMKRVARVHRLVDVVD